MSAAANTALPPFMPGIFRLDPDGAAELIGSHCTPCARSQFPAATLCPACLAPTQARSLGAHGHVYTYTVVRTKPPLGLPAPYAVGYVDLVGCDLRVFALLDAAEPERLRIGAPVRLQVAALGHDGHGNACLRPLFSPQPDREDP
ncbi:MAG: OB-fold domain-containing protein [Steroidobacteraceae bacterium]